MRITNNLSKRGGVQKACSSTDRALVQLTSRYGFDTRNGDNPVTPARTSNRKNKKEIPSKSSMDRAQLTSNHINTNSYINVSNLWR